MKNKRVLGTTLIIIMIVLMGLSITMIASVSFVTAQRLYGNNFYFVVRQGIWILAGIVAFWLTSNVKYTWYKKNKLWIYLAGLGLLIAVLFMGEETQGAVRWIKIFGMTVQPSEFAKLMIIIYLAGIIDYNKKKKAGDIRLFMRIMVPLSLYMGLVLAEKAFSSTLQIAMIGLSMMFVSGINIGYIMAVLVSFGGIGVISVVKSPYRMKRILGFIGNSNDGNYQTGNSLIAIGSGKLLGKFYGNGFQKYYLPEIHTDYIFSGYAEEMGFIGSTVLICIYIALLVVIFITLLKKKDSYAKYLLTGIFIMFSLQIIGNIAVVSDLIPATGIPLPIMSYGGSSMIVTTASLGIVYNIIKSIYQDETMEVRRLKEENIENLEMMD